MTDPKPDILAVLEQEGVALKKRGRSMWGLCPFHNEKTPSFMVDPERQKFKCFGCGEGGDVIDFVQRLHSLGFKDALRHLGVTPGKLPPVDFRVKRKRELLRDFERWRRDAYNERCDAYNETWRALRRCRTMDEVERHASEMHKMPVLQHEIEILSEGNDADKYELYRAGF